ncbi:hypothetical protein B0T18DRAFT_9752 [Schizothecium vesticola]|uniref:Uncharacterized protein n=1 Tax=Schizothecium vesticola TaxID=314040 RepID=A0AA40F8W1_9PEZI|nr:hypothetical protein B0T18DRAFT_9752 [Schizothecium vesticola]
MLAYKWLWRAVGAVGPRLDVGCSGWRAVRRESGGVEGSWRRIGRVNSDGGVGTLAQGWQATRVGEGQAFRCALWANAAGLGRWELRAASRARRLAWKRERERKNQSRCLPTDGFSPVPALAQPKSWPGRWPIRGGLDLEQDGVDGKVTHTQHSHATNTDLSVRRPHDAVVGGGTGNLEQGKDRDASSHRGSESVKKYLPTVQTRGTYSVSAHCPGTQSEIIGKWTWTFNSQQPASHGPPQECLAPPAAHSLGASQG